MNSTVLFIPELVSSGSLLELLYEHPAGDLGVPGYEDLGKVHREPANRVSLKHHHHKGLW